MRKVIAVIFILLLLVGLAYAGDAKKEDKGVLKDDSVTVDKTKESLKEIEKGIRVRDTSTNIAQYDVLKEKDKITISKADTVKDKKIEHTKTKLVMDEKTAKSIDVDKDGKFGYLRKVNGQVVDIKVVTLAELTTGIDATFSDIVIDGFAGSYTKIGSSQTVSTNMSLGQSFNSSRTSAVTVNISTTTYSDPYTEIAAMPTKYLWYKMDNTTGTSVIDSSGNGYTGTATNGPTWGTGKYNNCLDFDGSNDIVIMPDNSITRVRQNTTISLWIKPDSAGENSVGRIISKNNITTVGLHGYDLWIDVNIFAFESAAASISMTSQPITFGKWYHVVLDITNTYAKMYVNNVLVATDSSVSGYPPNYATPCYLGGRGGGTDRCYDGKIDNVIYMAGPSNETIRTKLYQDGLQQLQARTSANSTYSGYWNSTSNNPLTLPVSSLDGLISSIQFKVPTTVTQNGVTIYDYNQTAAPFTPIGTVYFTEDTTLISDSHTALVQTVNISHTSSNTAQDGELIPYDILDEYFGTIDFDTTNPNATITRNATDFMVDTGYITANTTYYYNVSIPNYVEEMMWSDWNPDNETCNAKVQIGNSTPYTTWNITTYNVTNGSLYKLVYAGNGTEVGNATAANGSASIIILGLVDGVYWLTETPVLTGFVNVPAVAVVIIGAAGAFVGGSFINKWYRRRRGS